MAAGLKIFWFTQLTASLLASKAQNLEQVPRQYGSRAEDILVYEAYITRLTGTQSHARENQPVIPVRLARETSKIGFAVHVWQQG